MGTRGRLDVGLLALLSAMALTCAWAYQERARLKSWAERLDSFLIPEDIPIGNTLRSLFIVSVTSLYLEWPLRCEGVRCMLAARGEI